MRTTAFFAAALLAATAPGAGQADPGSPDPAVTRVLHMTVAGFLTECQSNPADCAKDARSIDDRLQMEAVVRRVNNPTPLPSDYCEPGDMTDEARAAILVAYFRIHPELAASALGVGAQAAFDAAWSGRCAELDRQRAARLGVLEGVTVTQYLSACRSDEARCRDLTHDAGQELIRRSFRAGADQNETYAFCYPDLPESDVRAQVVDYLGQHPELASHTLIEGERKALNALYPNKDQC